MPHNPSFPTAPLRPLAIALAGLLLSSASWAATFVVNDSGDAPLGGAMCTGVPNPCTLRAAIQAANANADADTIQFDFSGGQVTISPTSALPPIVNPVTIDGYALGAGNPNTLAVGHDAYISIRIDGQNANAVVGLQFLPPSSGSALRGVAITRFNGAGVMVSGASHVGVQGNFIGTDGIDTTGALANGGEAVVIEMGATLTSVGGPSIGDRNLLVSDEDSAAVRLHGSGTEGNRITDNLIGTNRAGALRVATARGVEIGHANGNFVHGNVIGASQNGIFLYGDNAGHDNQITANRIGVGTAGEPIGGGGDGIQILDGVGASALGPQRTRIGGTNGTEGNTIAHWGGNGIRVLRQRSNTSLDQHAILGNSIHSNDALGIELVAPSTGSGPGNAPAGVNNAIPAPAITSTALAGGSLQVEYRLDGAAPNTLYRFEAFANSACDASGWGEGQRYLGAGMLATNAAGVASGSAVWGGIATGEFLTLTATRDGGGAAGLAETSEFSQCFPVAAGPGGGGSVTAVPTLGHLGLILLSALLGAVGLRARRGG